MIDVSDDLFNHLLNTFFNTIWFNVFYKIQQSIRLKTRNLFVLPNYVLSYLFKF